MIREYNYIEAYNIIGCAGPVFRARREDENRLYEVHGIVISSGQISVRLYDFEYRTYDYISLKDMAQEWVWEDGRSFGRDE